MATEAHAWEYGIQMRIPPLLLVDIYIIKYYLRVTSGFVEASMSPIICTLITLRIQMSVLNFASGISTLYSMMVVRKENNTMVTQDPKSCHNSFLFLFYFAMLFRRESHGALSSFKLSVELNLALNFWSSYLHQLSTKIQGVHHHSQLTW